MALSLGDTPIANLRVGDTQAQRAYLGTVLVWQQGAVQTWTRSPGSVTVTGTSGIWGGSQVWTASTTVYLNEDGEPITWFGEEVVFGLGAAANVRGTSGTWSVAGSIYSQPFDGPDGSFAATMPNSGTPVDLQLLNNKCSTVNSTQIHGGYAMHGVDLSGDWQLDFDVHATLVIGQGGVTVMLLDGVGTGWSIFAGDATHIQKYVTGGHTNVTNDARSAQSEHITLTRTTAGVMNVYCDGAPHGTATDNTQEAGAFLLVSLHSTTSPTLEATIDNLVLKNSITGAGPSPQTWTRSTGTLSVAGQSGTWSVAVAAQTWTGSTATITAVGQSGTWAAAQEWTRSTSTVTVTGTSGTWSVASGATFPSIATSNFEVGTSLSTNNPIPAPTGVAVGNLLVAFAVSDNPSTTDITGSTGWTRLSHTVQGSNILKMAVFARIADGGANDTLSLTGAAQDYCATIYRIIDHAVVTVTTDMFVAAFASTSNGNANPPNLDPGTARHYLWLTAAGVDTTTSNTLTAVPSGYTQIGTTLASTGGTSPNSTSSCILAVAQKTADTTSDDPGTFTNTSRPYIGVTVAVPKDPVIPLPQTWTRSAATVTATGTSGTWSVASPPGSTPVFRVARTSEAFTTTVSAVKPVGTVTGDLMIAFSLGFQGYYDPITRLSAPGDWTLVDRHRAAAGVYDSGIGIWWKIAGASEPTSYTFGNDGQGIVTIATIEAGTFNATTPINAYAHDVDATAGAAVVAPSMTPTVANCLGVGCWMADGGLGWTPPASWTERLDASEDGFFSALVATLDVPASATGVLTATAGSSPSAYRASGHLVAVAAAPTGTTATDDFNRADTAQSNGQINLGTGWHGTQEYDFGWARINSNQAQLGYNTVVLRDAACTTTNQYAEIQWNSTVGEAHGPVICATQATSSVNNAAWTNGYTLMLQHFWEGHIELRRNGLMVAEYYSTDWLDVPETFRIQKSGSVVKVFRAGSEVISYTDPTPLTGLYVGFANHNDNGGSFPVFDNFAGGDL